MKSTDCRDPQHHHYRDPAQRNIWRCIEHEEAWLDRMDEAKRAYKNKIRDMPGAAIRCPLPHPHAGRHLGWSRPTLEVESWA